ADRSRRLAAMALGCVTLAAPVALDGLGIIPHSLEFRDAALVVLPQIAELPRVPTFVTLTLANAVVLVAASILVGRARAPRAATEERLWFHAWQLRQLVPGEARDRVAPKVLTDTIRRR